MKSRTEYMYMCMNERGGGECQQDSRSVRGKELKMVVRPAMRSKQDGEDERSEEQFGNKVTEAKQRCLDVQRRNTTYVAQRM